MADREATRNVTSDSVTVEPAHGAGQATESSSRAPPAPLIQSLSALDNNQSIHPPATVQTNGHRTGGGSHDLEATGDTPTIPLPSSLAEDRDRNKAPGILDRRKSTRPFAKDRLRGQRGQRGEKRLSASPAIRISMADIGAEMRAKDGEGDSDTFEDAHDTTARPSSTEPIAEEPHTNGQKEEAAEKAKDDDTLHVADPMPLGGDAAKTETPSSPTQSAIDGVPSLGKPASPARERSMSPGKRHMQGLSGDFVVPTQPPPSTADRAHAIEQRNVGEERPGIVKQKSGGFGGFLSRMGSIRKARSPPAPRQDGRFGSSRRNTEASLPPNGLASIPDGVESGRAHRMSLRDQFQNLRRQEEYTMSGANGIAVDSDGENAPGVLRSHAEQIGSPTKELGEDSTRFQRSASTSGLKSPTLNPSLPPGTASGLTAGPAEEPTPVNWDLWQTVVYEGPTAVQRTSGKELTNAIAAGIPPAIRGVVWQVLAESKSDELETIYRTLKARGTDAEHQSKPAPMLRTESQNAMNGGVEKGSVTSSRSSVHSESSTPATSTMTSPPASEEGNGADIHARLLAEKQKRESTMLTKLEKAIKRDLGARTSYSKYTQSAGLQDGLFGVCKAYALFDEGVGYAQGINFIAMPLLFNMSEEEAFTLLVRLMSKYDLRSMFTADMPGLHLRLYQFERLLEDIEPALYCHLRRRKVEPALYACQWFLTLFAYRFPLQLVLRVYDLIFSEGLTAILKFGIVLMQRNREALLEMKDMGQLTTFLKEKLFDVYIDKSPSASSLLDSGFFGSVTGGADKELYRAEEMVHDACTVVISDETLAQYTSEWEETQRQDRERTEELENLRTTNISLTSHVKALEERTQQQDTEHVSIAGDLVKLKVDNEALQDENEGLKMKVEELQKMVDAQPAEIEEKLKGEMERIMQRNIEVQNENRSLKEEAEEMEGELVNAKMMHAQARSDHETLQQRLASAQALLSGQ